jgi:outer membrane protein assembly factor BamA
MHGGTSLRCSTLSLTLSVIQALAWSSLLYAQADRTGCVSPPPGWASTEISIESMEFQEDEGLTSQTRTTIVDAVKRSSFSTVSASDEHWLRALEEIARFSLQEQGHFTAAVDARASLILAEPQRLHYQIYVETKSGPQYRLGEVRFSHALEFTDAELRKEIPLNQNEVFNLAKVRDGLDRIRRLYLKKGYIDFTSDVESDIEDANHRVNLSINIQQGVQYRIGSVEAKGDDTGLQDLLKLALRPGQVFDPGMLDAFFDLNKSRLPTYASAYRDSNISRDSLNGTVAIVVDLRACPPH